MSAQTWTCAACGTVQPAGTIITYPACVDREGSIRLLETSPACCPHCAELLPPGPGRIDVLVRYLGAVWRDGRTAH